MSKNTGLERFAPLTGVAFAAIAYLITLVLTKDEPDSTAPAVKVIAFWHEHHSREMAAGIAGVFTIVLLVWFAGSLREALVSAGSDRLATLSFAGAVIAAIGIGIFSGVGLTTADTVGKVPDAATLTLSALNADFFPPIAGGIALFQLAAGVAILRTGALAKWLGVLGVLFGLASMTPAGMFVGFGVFGWCAIVGVLLYRRGTSAATA